MALTAIQDGLLIFFCAAGMAATVWTAAGVFLRAGRPSIPGLLLILPVQGDAPAMEQDVRELRRIAYQIPGVKLILADCGLNHDARELARYLISREPGAVLTDAQKIGILNLNNLKI